jgi:hypothetical protein
MDCWNRQSIRLHAAVICGLARTCLASASIRGLRCSVTLAMLGYVLEGLQYGSAAYITALTIDLFTVVFGFVTALDVIMQQPMEVSER